MNLFTGILLLVLIPTALYATNTRLLGAKFGCASISAASALMMYAFLLAGVAIYDSYLDVKLAAFDLNGDGIFSSDEITHDQEAAMNRVIWDTGRNFAPITGAIFAIVYFLCCWAMLSTFARAYKLYLERDT